MRLAAALLVATTCAVQAAELPDWLRLDGFGTVAAYMANDPNAGVLVDASQAHVARDGQWRGDGDTQLSLQASIDEEAPVRGVVQLLSKKDAFGRWTPQVEWAYLGWRANPELDIKLGRSALSTFAHSSHRNLFYALDTARLNELFYTAEVQTFNDGLSLLWQRPLARGTVQLDAFAGRAKIDTATTTTDITRQFGASVQWSTGASHVRAGAARITFDIDSADLDRVVASIDQLPVAVCSNCTTIIARAGGVRQLNSTIHTVGAGTELGPVSLRGEYATRRSDNIWARNLSKWYVLGAWRINDWTPYLSMARLRLDNPPERFQATGLASAQVSGFLDLLNRAAVLGHPGTWQYTAGVRWDVASGVAVKAQASRFVAERPDVVRNQVLAVPLVAGGSGFDGRVTLFSLGVDFLF